MDNNKSDEYYIHRIIQDLEFVVEHMKKVDIEELNRNEVLLDSMLFRMIQISENSKRLTNQYREEHADIPWYALYGMRNRIVHDYGSVDLNIIYSTLKDDIPEMLVMIQNLFANTEICSRKI